MHFIALALGAWFGLAVLLGIPVLALVVWDKARGVGPARSDAMTSVPADETLPTELDDVSADAQAAAT